ncbi:hypothetical protein BH11BAC3_BH11BAC3_09820 [soil metagenome]
MSNMLRKALGLFVEFGPEETKSSASFNDNDALPLQVTSTRIHHPEKIVQANINESDLEKFERHFDELFDKANLPGPDYYEFYKMMETLEAAVTDENIRMAAVYSTLKIQGMSKEMLVSSAEKYRQVIDKDKQDFQQAVKTKVTGEIEGRKTSIDELEKRNKTNAEMIQNLTKEINESRGKITALKKEITDAEAKIDNNLHGYNIACDAMLIKLTNDIEKIKSTL